VHVVWDFWCVCGVGLLSGCGCVSEVWMFVCLLVYVGVCG
jgi:hypothetical protein